jgi:hypothetical protein
MRRQRSPMLKILRTTDRNIVFTLIGRLETKNIAEVRGLLAAEPPGQAIALDLTDLILVGRDAVRFLRSCKQDGIALRNCPPFIRIWMERDEEH